MDQVAKAIEQATGAGNSELACAKINLALHVGAERPDGYHDLESLVVFADVADVVTVRPAATETTTLALAGPYADRLDETTAPDANLVLRAAQAIAAVAARRRVKPVHLHLTKRIPVAAGLGGGSADAAATLRLLDRIWDLQLKPGKLAEIGVALGADVPMCLVSRPLIARGIGEVVTPVGGIPALPVVLAHPGPGVHLPTGAVFAGLGREERSGLPTLPAKFRSALELVFWLRQTRNDLIDPARVVTRKAVVAAKALANDPDCLFARMSGSGAAAFGIFVKPAAAERAAERLKAEKPDWWVTATTTGGS
jgi:4-diphosphocytidyl-2-C-methyl-D-erythritol kinase